MKKIQKHPVKKWEVSLIQLEDKGTVKYKVTRRIPELGVAETKMVYSKKKAKLLFEQWLRE